MKPKIFLFALLALSLAACSEPKTEKRDAVFIKTRDFILTNDALKVKPPFISLPAGAVHPEGWINDWATDALNGITGHLDEWNATFEMAWKGVEFEAEGAEPNGMGWPLEQCAYWLDGAVRLAYIMNDTTLINKVSQRLNNVVDGVLFGEKSFIYWQKVDFSKTDFDNWAHSHMGRALVAYYEATGNSRILMALAKVYSDFCLVPLTYHNGGVSGANNADPMLATYKLWGDGRIINEVLKMAADTIMQQTIAMWENKEVENGHGVVFYENLRIPAMIYPYTGNPRFLNATLNCFNWLDEKHLQPYGIASSEEQNAGKGSTRNTETCNIAASAWSYQQMYEITGQSNWGDRIEQVFFNAAAASVSRDFKTMTYFQSPNRIEGLLPHDTPGHPSDRGGSSYEFRPTGHTVLCCVGNLNRIIPNYIQHIWMGTLDKGLAATLYGPATLNAVAGEENTPVKIITRTNYPFAETIEMSIKPDKTTQFPIYLRIPAWTNDPQIKVNGKAITVESNCGFVKIDRKWEKGDKIEIYLPMHAEITTGNETPYPDVNYFQKGSSAGRGLAFNREINSPFRTISYGPLLFSLPVRDIDPNHQAEGEKWNYALVSDNAAEVQIQHQPMPARWSWQIDEAPVRLTVKAGAFDWQPTEMTPIPETEVDVDVANVTDVTLVPYGCTKFRITMFPIAKKQPEN